MPTPSGTRLVDSKLAISIINKRTTLKQSDANQLMQFIIQGTPQFLPKGHKYVSKGEDRENQYDRTIYNLRANSAIAMVANKSLFTEALKAESAADAVKAHDLFNEYLNKIQISFSIIENGTASVKRFANGDIVKGLVGTSVDKDGITAIIVDNVTALAVTAAVKTTFSVEDLMEA